MMATATLSSSRVAPACAHGATKSRIGSASACAPLLLSHQQRAVMNVTRTPGTAMVPHHLSCKRRTMPTVSMKASAVAAQGAAAVVDGGVSIVLLSGGVGKRMGASIPKQYLELRGQPIATWSLETFLAMPEVGEVVIVCDPSWKHIFEDALKRLGASKPVKFALPGAERQDSMTNGFKEINDDAQLVAIHDSARPLVTPQDCSKCFADAMTTGAAVLGVAVKPTIKEVGDDGFVVKTLQRSRLWEVQTPQVIVPALLTEGIELVAKESLEVTDDVSIIEALGKPVKITGGSYTNIKVTTPDDMSIAERFLDEQAAAAVAA